MSATKNNRRRCDKCGKISSNQLGEYVRKNGACGYINHQEGDVVGDTCDDCREKTMNEELKDLVASVETIITAVEEMQSNGEADGEVYLNELESIATYADTQLRAALLRYKQALGEKGKE